MHRKGSTSSWQRFLFWWLMFKCLSVYNVPLMDVFVSFSFVSDVSYILFVGLNLMS